MQKAWVKLLIITTAFIVGLLSIAISKTKNNIVEQAAEVVLQAEGINIDLSKDD